MPDRLRKLIVGVVFVLLAIASASDALALTGSVYAGSSFVAYNFPNQFSIGSKTLAIVNGGAAVSIATNGTVIKLALPSSKGGPVTIKIYSVLGQLVRILDFGNLTGGAYYYFTWEGDNDGSQTVTSDVYYAIVTYASPQESATLYFLDGVGGAGQTLTKPIPTLAPGTISVPTRAGDTANPDGTAILVIRGTATGEASAVGGAKGYVNPAKGEKLTIGFKATGPGTIVSKIFDNRGRLVREMSAPTDGSQGGSLQWDGRDSAGNTVSSGVYLIHVEGPGINTTKRTVILR